MASIFKNYRWHRFGDINMEHGGGFYSFEGWPHYVDIIRVTPCSDAGGPDNQFWVESGTLFMKRKRDELKRAREIFGQDEEFYQKLTRAQKRHYMVEAILASYGLDNRIHWSVQIGQKPDPNHSDSFTPLVPDYVLRANRSLEKYIYECRQE